MNSVSDMAQLLALTDDEFFEGLLGMEPKNSINTESLFNGAEGFLELPDSPPSPSTSSPLFAYVKPEPDAFPQEMQRRLRKRKNNNKLGREVTQNTRKKSKSVKVEEEEAEFIGTDDGNGDKHRKRLEANKKSAQASRERKKMLKSDLEKRVIELDKENKILHKEMIELQTENKVLKSEFIQLQKIISQANFSQLCSTKTDERGQISTDPKDQEVSSTSNFSPAGFMYLMIVLQSFSQHFMSLLPESKHISIPNPSHISVR